MYRSMSRCNAGAGPFIQLILTSVEILVENVLFPDVDTITFTQHQH